MSNREMEMEMEVESGCSGCSSGREAAGFLEGPIGRRKFVSLGVYAAAAAALAACAGVSDSVSASTSVAATVKVSDYSELATVGGVAVTSLNGTPIAIVRTSTTSFITLSRICPHQGSTINATSTGFRCPNHGATFDSVGTWIGG